MTKTTAKLINNVLRVSMLADQPEAHEVGVYLGAVLLNATPVYTDAWFKTDDGYYTCDVIFLNPSNVGGLVVQVDQQPIHVEVIPPVLATNTT